jgi:hypothetical protein
VEIFLFAQFGVNWRRKRLKDKAKNVRYARAVFDGGRSKYACVCDAFSVLGSLSMWSILAEQTTTVVGVYENPESKMF